MILLITSLCAGGAILMARILTRSSKANADSKSDPASTPKNLSTSKDPLEGFPCHLGDVVLRTDGQEAWLAGAIVFSERDRTSRVIFIAPDAGGDHAIFAADSSPRLLWLRAVSNKDLLIANEPPTAIEIGNVRFERQRRLPLRALRIGSGAEDVGPTAIVAEYTSATIERLIVIAGSNGVHAWRGAALEDGMYEIIASGKSTL